MKGHHVRTHLCKIPTQKEVTKSNSTTVGGDRIHSLLDCSTSTVDLLTVKIQLSSVISTHGAQYMKIDIKDLNLDTPM